MNAIDSNIRSIIKEHSINEKITKPEIQSFLELFEQAMQRKGRTNEVNFKEAIEIRSKLGTNQALSKIFSPGKLKIMEKIFNHTPLTNTELKYYYRSIRPRILAILNENLERYVRVVETSKKYLEK